MSTTSRFSRRAVSLMALALAAAATLTACGSSSTANTSTSSAAGAGPTAGGSPAAAGLTSISVMRPLNTGFEPLIIAQDQGFFTQNGLAVKLVLASADTSAGIPRLLNGEVQFVNGGAPQAIKAVANNLPVQLIAGVQSSEKGAAASDGLLVPKNSSIKTLADLKGKKVGVSGLGGTTQVVNNIALRAAGVDPSTVTYVNLAPPALQAAAEKGQVDAVLIFGLYYTQALATFRVIDAGTTNLPGTLQVGYLATTAYLKANPTVAQKFIKALGQATAYADAHPDAVRAADTKYTKLPASYIASMAVVPYSTQLNLATITKLSDELVTMGVIKKAPATDQLVWSSAPTS